MITVIIPFDAQVMADFGVGYIVHGGVTSMVNTGGMTLAKKACVGIVEMAIVGIGCDKVNEYIDDSFDKAAEFIVKHDLDKKFMKGDKK